jgi:hypothetical protein
VESARLVVERIVAQFPAVTGTRRPIGPLAERAQDVV